MKEVTSSKAATSVGVIAAIAASLCCITPVLALFAGASGAASSLSWLEPARPYLIALAIATLGFSWYRSLSKKESIACGPDGSCAVEKKSFLASRTFLTIITVAAIALIAFPNYSKVFYPKAEKQNVVVVESNNIQTASFQIKGMTCGGCEEHVNSELSKVSGVIESQTSYAKGISTVKFDKSRASIEELKNAIAKTGYKVTNYQLSKK